MSKQSVPFNGQLSTDLANLMDVISRTVLMALLEG